MLREHEACARCGVKTPLDDLRLYTTRERLREYARRTKSAAPAAALTSAALAPTEAKVLQAAGAPGDAAGPAAPAAAPEAPAKRGRGVTYRWVTMAHALCPDCHDAVSRDGRRFADPDRRRALFAAVGALLVAALIWAAYAPFSQVWIAAFFRNGVWGR